MRMPLMMFTSITVPIGMVLYGWSAQVCLLAFCLYGELICLTNSFMYFGWFLTLELRYYALVR